jgi:hypothetical protein
MAGECGARVESYGIGYRSNRLTPSSSKPTWWASCWRTVRVTRSGSNLLRPSLDLSRQLLAAVALSVGASQTPGGLHLAA